MRDDVVVRGENYPVPPSKQFLASCFQYFQLFLFFSVFFGDHLSKLVLQGSVPAPLQALCDNKMASFMFIWLIGNMVASSFMQSGAFEIYYHNKTVWSSLANGNRMPAYQDIMRGCKAAGLELMPSQSR